MAEAASGSANTATAHGRIPEGIWVMNPARSKRLVPGTHTLWIIKDDGIDLIFASVETDTAGTVKLTSWQGRYNGPPVEVIGSGMMAQVTSPGPHEMLITGDIPGMGRFTEHCLVTEQGKRLRCTGRIEAADGPLEYVDDFDWFSASPSPLSAGS